MKPDGRFVNLRKDFWANVRTISEECGYTSRSPRNNPLSSQVKVPSIEEIKQALENRGLVYSHIANANNTLTDFGKLLISYYGFRANVLNNTVEKLLLNAEKAHKIFDDLKSTLNPTCQLPFNKQKDTKKAPAYFTGIINMLIEANSAGYPCDYDPHKLTTVTRDLKPLRTFARRIDGAFPSIINPVAVWEVKEYYYTTTFGSRVADGVYETLLDGHELEELQEHEGVEVKHYLMIDDYYTWWECGKSYLCRIIDMLHMGYVDEVLFGYEVVERLPNIVKEWISLVTDRNKES
ncbi:MAG: hypothetical protein GYA55_10375 [SAR324 cluster bacterium]|uniref:Uncharacterized protein n=1 Tax=SAR324 cluster bacterium TaxID=2024889 RepID=A0A7X9FSY0_9DELT|nr:hypothetical protein [SAR324 cluster bacterium]